MMQNFGNRRSVQKCAQNAGSNVLKEHSTCSTYRSVKIEHEIFKVQLSIKRGNKKISVKYLHDFRAKKMANKLYTLNINRATRT